MSEGKRSRATKKQVEVLISYIENNKEMCNGNDEKKWQEVMVQLNAAGGAMKTVKQWKSVFADLKTNVRRRARALKFQMEGTGGGPAAKKPLSDIEERVLGLMSKISVEGADLEEIGVVEVEVVEVGFPEAGYIIDVDPSTAHTGTTTEETAPPVTRKTPSTMWRKRKRRNTEDGNHHYLKLLAESNNNVARGLMAVARSLNLLAKRK